MLTEVTQVWWQQPKSEFPYFYSESVASYLAATIIGVFLKHLSCTLRHTVPLQYVLVWWNEKVVPGPQSTWDRDNGS